MTRIKKSFVLSLILTVFGATTFAQSDFSWKDKRFEAYVLGGMAIPTLKFAQTININTGVSSTLYTIGVLTGPHASLNGGWNFSKYIGAQAEISYSYNRVDINSMKEQVVQQDVIKIIRRLEISSDKIQYAQFHLGPHFHVPIGRFELGIALRAGVSLLISPKLDVGITTKELIIENADGSKDTVPEKNIDLKVNQQKTFNVSGAVYFTGKYNISNRLFAVASFGVYDCIAVFKDVESRTYITDQSDQYSNDDIKIHFSSVHASIGMGWRF